MESSAGGKQSENCWIGDITDWYRDSGVYDGPPYENDDLGNSPPSPTYTHPPRMLSYPSR